MLTFTVNYDEAVIVTGSPRLPFRIGVNPGAARNATYEAATSTPTSLKFSYTVLSTDVDSDGIVINAANLDLNGATIRDAAGTDALLALNGIAATAGIFVNGSMPRVTQIAPPANGSFVTGSTLAFTLTFNTAVAITGTPRLQLTFASGNRFATFRSLDAAKTKAVFEYVVSDSDWDQGGIVLSPAIALNGGLIQNDVAGTNASLQLPQPLPDLTAVVIPPRFTTLNGQPVAASISPRATPVAVFTFVAPPTPITLADIEMTRDGTRITLFPPTGLSARLTANGSVYTLDTLSSFTSNDGTYVLTVSEPTTGTQFSYTWIMDGNAPSLNQTIAQPANGTYVAGEQLRFIATFSESMRVTGTPRIALTIGSSTRYANYESGDETNKLVFAYTVAPGDSDLDGIVAASAISLNGGTIADLSGNVGSLTFTPLSLTNVLVDALPPTITRFSVPTSTLNGLYGIGAVIPIVATASESVATGSEIAVTLNSGGVLRLRANTNGTTFTGNYTVAAGETSSDLSVASFTDVNVTDLAGNGLASTALPTSGNNIADARAIVIDGTSPTAPTVASLTTNVRKPTITGTATLLAGETLAVTINGVTFNNVPVTSGAWSLNTATATGSSAFNDLNDGTYSVTATVTDAAGNAASDTTTGELVIDTVRPTTPTVTALATTVRKPTITGTATLLAGETLAVTINGVTFNNVSFMGNSWSLNTATATGSSAFNDLNDNTYSVTATVTDAAGNATSDTTTGELVIDTVAPSITILSSTATLGGSQTATITFTLSEASTNFALSDVAATGGTLSNFAGSNASYTATFTPAAGSTANGTISVAANVFTDAVGNGNTAGALATPIVIDTVSPSVAITTNKTSLRIGETATITFTLSEASTNFALSDIAATGGTLSNFQVTPAGGGIAANTVYTATFTPAAGSTANGTISVAANVFTDAASNGNTAGTLAPTIAIDTIAPAVTISSNTPTLANGQTATITFTLSEASANFELGDAVATSGTLSNFQVTPAGGSIAANTVYTATFTPTPSPNATATVSVAAGTFTDSTGNPNTAGALALPILIDTVAPSITILSSTATLGGSQTATITFTLSEASTNFALSDVAATGGTLSNFAGSNASYTATFTPAAGSTANGTISVAANVFTDAVGNGNTAGALATPIVIDTVSPSVAITTNKTSLRIGETATITFTLSEASTNFALSDIAATGGTLSNFQVTPAGGGIAANTVYTATFTPTSNFAGTGSVSVAAGLLTDAAGNGNSASNLLTIAIDTVAPAAPTFALANDTGASSTDGNTSIGTFNVAGLESGATWQYSTDGVNWTNGSGTSFNLGSGGYAANAIRVRQTDPAGNTGPSAGNVGSVTVDNAAPAIVSITSPSSGTRTAGETVVVNATVSEQVQAGSSVTVTLDTGNVVTLTAATTGTVLTGSFTIQPGQSSSNLRVFAIGLTNGGARDIAGNTLVSTVVPNSSLGATPLVIDAVVKATAAGFSSDPNVVIDRRVAVRSIPITFSTPVTGFTLVNLRLTVNGRSVSLRGATLRGSGASYTLVLPAKATNLNGIYTLEIGAQGPVIRAIANGAELTTPSTIYWGKGRSIGITQSTARAAAFAASAAPKPAPAPRAAAFRRIR